MKQKRKGSCFLCGKHNVSLCPNCGDLHTCQLHFLFHHQNNYCFPFRILWKADDSLSLVASRDIQPLELILFEKALAVGPKVYEANPKVCSECLAEVKTGSKCGLCQLYVCGDQCQIGHNHYTECQILKGIRRNNTWSDSVKLASVLPIRILASCDINESGYNRAKLLHSSPTASIIDDSLKDVVDLVDNCTTAEEDNVKWAVEVARKKCVETHDFRGSAFFPIFSLTKHSCGKFNNAKFFVFPNNCLAMQAQKPICMGEELCVSFVPTLEPTWKRRGMLFRNRLEMCSCDRCKDPTEFGSFLQALKCQKCSEDAHSPILPKDPLDPESFWHCKIHTAMQIPSQKAQQLAIDLQIDLYAEGLVTTIQRLEEKISMMMQFLHPNHGLLMAAKRSLVNCYSQVPLESAGKDHQVKMRNLCLEQLQVMEKIDASGYPDWKGDILQHLSTAELNLARLDLQAGIIERPAFLLQVKNAMRMVQEGIRCKSCVKIARSNVTLDQMISSLSDSESRNSSIHGSFVDLRYAK